MEIDPDAQVPTHVINRVSSVLGETSERKKTEIGNCLIQERMYHTLLIEFLQCSEKLRNGRKPCQM
jgi:hypothetical protein